MPTLPSRIILFIPTRTGANRFILVDVAIQPTPPAWILTPVDTITTGFKLELPENTMATNLGRFVIRTCDGILLNKQLKAHPGLVITNAANEVLQVISMSLHTTIFGSHKLKSNMAFTHSAIPVPVSPVADISGDQVVHVAEPAVIKKKKKTIVPIPAIGMGQGGLEKFVAKQLLDLAILRKEMCPITAEEFSVGNTAAMPCGHLFMQFAIEESFKKEKDKCPWCRQVGRPTYI
jgi:hypothetical protein